MNDNTAHINTLETDARIEQKGAKKDYADLLQEYNLSFKGDNFYLRVGSSTIREGWIIHLSAVTCELPNLLRLILPLLALEKVPFKIARNEDIAKAILDGNLGFNQLGKVISIYPQSVEHAVTLVQRLVVETQGTRGPRILTDRHLGAVVYTRYGAFDPSITEPLPEGTFGMPEQHYTIPFRLAKGLGWPFGNMVPATENKARASRIDKYKRTQILKTDAKGDVVRAHFMKGFFAKTCIIKEGKYNMMCDEHGRDIKDRLLWQLHLHQLFSGAVSVPKIYDHFEEAGDYFLVMEHIEGMLLDDIVVRFFQNTVWPALDTKVRLQLLDYGLQVIHCIEGMHQMGYVHRDITPMNFIITTGGKLFMIDLELAYNLNTEYSVPPFALGTHGFMSPEQQAISVPTVQEDIYGIGALLLVLFTGLLPEKFSTGNPEMLKQQLAFFIPDKGLVSLIGRCLSIHPEIRPGLAEIKNRLQQTITETASGNSAASDQVCLEKDPDTALDKVIQSAIDGLMDPAMISPSNLWYSRKWQLEGEVYSQVKEMSIYSGLYTGQAGVMYLLARAKQSGFNIKGCMPGYSSAMQLLIRDYLERMDEVPGGLSQGLAGIAVALTEGLNSGLLQPNPAANEGLAACLQNPNVTGLDVLSGMAGQGMALLYCADLLPESFVQQRLASKIEAFLSRQRKDGSWVQSSAQAANDLALNAGITQFLLAFAVKRKEPNVRQAIAQSLRWIKSNERPYKEPRAKMNASADMIPGKDKIALALAYIKAFEILEDESYRKLGEEILNTFPEAICSRDISQGTGLAGLGEVYLEAARVFGAKRWQRRADWITRLLLHNYRLRDDESVYWMVDDSPFATADFMTGQSGIIHYLLRARQIGQFTYPFLRS